MNNRIKIGLIGAGKRVHEMYGPIFKTLQDRYHIVGFHNNNQERTNKVVEAFGFKHFNDIKQLEKEVDAFCVVVNSNVNTTALFSLLNYNKPILLKHQFGQKKL